MNALKTLLFSLLLLTAHSCSCFPATLAENYAGAEVVVRARVQSVTISRPSPRPCSNGLCQFVEGTVTHVLRLQRRLKGCRPTRTFVATSSDQGSLCGITLAAGRSFVLFLRQPSVRVADGRSEFAINLCGGIRVWASLTRPERRFLLRRALRPRNRCLMR